MHLQRMINLWIFEKERFLIRGLSEFFSTDSFQQKNIDDRKIEISSITYTI